MADETADIKLGPTGKSISLPIRPGTLGPHVIDVSSLYKNQVFTYDPGFMSTASCESKITFIDGDEGILLHHGYPIEQLAHDSDYLEVCYLLLHGELPNETEKKAFVQEMKDHSMVYQQVQHFFKGFPRDAHPMSMLMGVVGGMSGFYPEFNDLKLHRTAAMRLIAKMPTLAAMCHKHAAGQPFMVAQDNLGYSENFLYMVLTNSYDVPHINPVLSRAIDRILLLHADHEQNASTSTVRLAGSTGTHPFAAVSAGIASLWGPAHGGANEAALNMLKEIGDESRIGLFIARAKDPNDSFRLMGFGHRVYKNFDPRAKVMRSTCHEVLEAVGAHDHPLFKVALKLEKIALEDPYFIERKLYPNVDFYSGLTLSAMGIPTHMFTVIFALARTAGWLAQWIELITSEEYRIGRPRQLYTGHTRRDFVPLNQR